ncbi:hypothetical protein [Rhodocaloribacter sp.]
MKARMQRWLAARRARRVTRAWARERAARGAAYLDAVDPDWSRRIDPETLTLADGACCVLGQLHGEFRMGMSRAGLFNMSSAPRANLSPVDYGFHAVLFGDEALHARDYAFLDEAWRDEIRRRSAGNEHPREVSAGRREAGAGDAVGAEVMEAPAA